MARTPPVSCSSSVGAGEGEHSGSYSGGGGERSCDLLRDSCGLHRSSSPSQNETEKTPRSRQTAARPSTRASQSDAIEPAHAHTRGKREGRVLEKTRCQVADLWACKSSLATYSSARACEGNLPSIARSTLFSHSVTTRAAWSRCEAAYAAAALEALHWVSMIRMCKQLERQNVTGRAPDCVFAPVCSNLYERVAVHGRKHVA
jgi:hypothetical protein